MALPEKAGSKRPDTPKCTPRYAYSYAQMYAQKVYAQVYAVRPNIRPDAFEPVMTVCQAAFGPVLLQGRQFGTAFAPNDGCPA